MQYWALAPREEIAAEIMGKWTDYHNFLDRSGYGNMIQSLYDQFYNFDQEGGFRITKTEDGSISKLSVNMFKALVLRLHILVTQNKLAFQPRARNSDSDSQIQSDFSKGLLEYYGDEKNLNLTTSEAVLRALILLENFIYSPWDENVGDEVSVADGRVIRAGDQAYYNLSAFDVARNVKMKKSPYYIVREIKNRWDLAADYADDEEKLRAILTAGTINNSSNVKERLITPFDTNEQFDDDCVYVYTLLHAKTKALPQGRMTVVCNNVWLEDSAFIYSEMPVTRLSAGEILETIGGDSPATTLMGLQQGIDALYSAVTTNNLNHAISNIYSPDENISIDQISAGQNLIKAAEKPEAISLVNSASETYKLIDQFQDVQLLLSGLNSTVMGDPNGNVKTAGGQALQIAQATQFVSTLMQNYAQAVSDVATITIKNLQKFASEPRLAYIGGVSRRSYVKTFTQKDIDGIDRVSVDLGSPLMQSISGRYQLAEIWMQQGILKDPRQIITFLKTGEIDSALEDQFKASILIRSENEQLLKGKVPPVLVSDQHPQHILEHLAQGNDEAYRNNPGLMEANLAHVMDHITKYKGMDPDLAAILGLPPLPSQQPPAPPPGIKNPNQGVPEVQGQNVPPMPQGAPPETQAAYEQALANNPAAQIPPEAA